MGRPRTAPGKLKDGFYIEVHTKSVNSGIKIWRKNEEEMMKAVKEFRRTRQVSILGEHRSSQWISKPRKTD